jgi:hypothetical protein
MELVRNWYVSDTASDVWAPFPLSHDPISDSVCTSYARIHRLGIKGLQADDYLMMLAGCLYTILIVCLNVISSGGGSNLYEPEQFSTFTPQDIKERIQGSKIVIASEQVCPFLPSRLRY